MTEAGLLLDLVFAGVVISCSDLKKTNAFINVFIEKNSEQLV